jgi:hypothetical protein
MNRREAEEDNGYLSEVLFGNYPEKSEDRLTQTFAATFNHSARFRKRFWKLIGRNPARATFLRARTQQTHSANGTQSRLDTVIVNASKKPVAIIENKVEAPLYSEQLKRYGILPGFGHVLKIAVVKNYFDLEDPPDWKIVHWSEVHGAIDTASAGWPDEVGTFVARTFLNQLENLRMARISVIEEKRLRDFAKAVHTLRKERAAFSLAKANVFETAADYMSMLEELVGHIRTDKVLSRRLGKSVRFSARIQWWRDAAGKPPYLWIGYHTWFRKRKNGFRAIGTGISFYPHNGRYTIDTYAQKAGHDEKVFVH